LKKASISIQIDLRFSSYYFFLYRPDDGTINWSKPVAADAKEICLKRFVSSVLYVFCD